MKFISEDKKSVMTRKDGFLYPPKIGTTQVIRCPVNALETWIVTENEHYKR